MQYLQGLQPQYIDAPGDRLLNLPDEAAADIHQPQGGYTAAQRRYSKVGQIVCRVRCYKKFPAAIHSLYNGNGTVAGGAICFYPVEQVAGS